MIWEASVANKTKYRDIDDFGHKDYYYHAYSHTSFSTPKALSLVLIESNWTLFTTDAMFYLYGNINFHGIRVYVDEFSFWCLINQKNEMLTFHSYTNSFWLIRLWCNSSTTRGLKSQTKSKMCDELFFSIFQKERKMKMSLREIVRIKFHAWRVSFFNITLFDVGDKRKSLRCKFTTCYFPLIMALAAFFPRQHFHSCTNDDFRFSFKTRFLWARGWWHSKERRT